MKFEISAAFVEFAKIMKFGKSVHDSQFNSNLACIKPDKTRFENYRIFRTTLEDLEYNVHVMLTISMVLL